MGFSLTLLSCTTLLIAVLCLLPGSDVVDWLYSHVEGFQDRREARKYACNLLKVMLNLCFNTVAGFFHHRISRDVNIEDNPKIQGKLS